MTLVGPGWARSRAPSALVTPTAGIVTSLLSPRVAPMCSSSTLSATTIATPPNLATIATFSEKGQLPRSTSTTAPRTGSPS